MDMQIGLADRLKAVWQSLEQNKTDRKAVRTDFIEETLAFGRLLIEAGNIALSAKSTGLGNNRNSRMHDWLQKAGIEMDKSDRSAYRNLALAKNEAVSRKVMDESESWSVQVLWKMVRDHPDYVPPEKKGKDQREQPKNKTKDAPPEDDEVESVEPLPTDAAKEVSALIRQLVAKIAEQPMPAVWSVDPRQYVEAVGDSHDLGELRDWLADLWKYYGDTPYKSRPSDDADDGQAHAQQ